jgi:hypothetical protein
MNRHARGTIVMLGLDPSICCGTAIELINEVRASTDRRVMPEDDGGARPEDDDSV